jgi:hypothetical protein
MTQALEAFHVDDREPSFFGETDGIAGRGRPIGLVALGVSVAMLAFAVYGFASLAFALHAVDKGVYPTESDIDAIFRDRRVLDTASRLMPRNANYRVLIGPSWQPARHTRWSRSLEADFLRYYLLPRRQTSSRDASWAFCLGCDLSAVHARVQVLTRGSDGSLFVRIRR